MVLSSKFVPRQRHKKTQTLSKLFLSTLSKKYEKRFFTHTNDWTYILGEK